MSVGRYGSADPSSGHTAATAASRLDATLLIRATEHRVVRHANAAAEQETLGEYNLSAVALLGEAASGQPDPPSSVMGTGTQGTSFN